MEGWSWRELQETPPYVRQAFWDISQERRRAEAERAGSKQPQGSREMTPAEREAFIRERM